MPQLTERNQSMYLLLIFTDVSTFLWAIQCRRSWHIWTSNVDIVLSCTEDGKAETSV